ncbi:hypothetical protein V8J88_07765 [Massilia sp. W12]|uniref:hypothetical protein n=1 Tax=Massilia sp. W12 TaxID=3126507 RepID=UPI0030CBC04A
MNPQALHYLKLLQAQGSRHPSALDFSAAPAIATTDEEIAQLVARQRQQYGADHSEQFAAHGLHMGYWLQQLEQDLYQDLLDYCDPAERALMARLALGFLHNLRCNACVFPVAPTEDAHKDGAQAATESATQAPAPLYVMGVNVGLFQMAGLLCEALLWQAQDDSQRAHASYLRARDLFFVRSRRDYEAVILDEEVHPIKQQSGEIAALVLRFIALHELGHIALGHVEQLDMQLNALQNDVLYANAAAHSLPALQAMENAADRFAIMHMAQVSGSAQQMWNNTLFICALFHLLDHIEARLGQPLSQQHPPPARRAALIQAQVQDAIGAPPNQAMDWLGSLMQQWKEA